MKSTRVVLLVLMLWPILATAQLAAAAENPLADEFIVTFRLHAPELPDDTKVYITGSLRGLGNWNPGRVEMKYKGDHVWSHQLTVNKKQTIEYKYTLGSWDREAADSAGQPLKNLVVAVDKSMEKRDRINNWTKRRKRIVRGQITGQVKYHRQIEGDGIRARDIIVWLPPGYETSSGSYPVLYMHDGQNIIDPKTSSFGADWEVDETCTELIAEKRIKPLIVVGIYNTTDRSREYLPGPQGTAYMNFVVNNLKPFIDQNYRTKPQRQYTWSAGSSLGALSAFMLTWEHSDVFSKAFCMSAAFKYGGEQKKPFVDYVAVVQESPRPDKPVYFYIDNGGVGLEANLQPGIDDMLKALASKGFKSGRDFHWIHAPDDRHHESAWAKRFPHALQLMIAGD